MVDNTFRTAYVYIRNEFAGILCEADEGYTFSYDEEYLDRENAGFFYIWKNKNSCVW